MQRNDKGQFEKGQSGNPAGRPRGSRAKLGEAFLTALYAHWIDNGAAVIERVSQRRPDVYLRMVASLLPKHFEINDDPYDGVTDEELAGIIACVQNTLRMLEAGEPEENAAAHFFAGLASFARASSTTSGGAQAMNSPPQLPAFQGEETHRVRGPA
jgi:hypothetical protein